MSNRSLPVLMPVIDGQRWSCHSCGDCCRTLVGHLTPTERDRIIEQEWEQRLGTAPVVRVGRSWMLNKREGGACVFLDADNRCRIHAEYGEDAKPLACRIFPFSVRPTPRGWQTSLRFDCPSVTGSRGAVISTHRTWLNRLVGELPEPPAFASAKIHLTRGIVAQADEIEAITRRVSIWLGDASFSMLERIVGLAKVVTLVRQAQLKNVRGPRFEDLLEILFETIREEAELEVQAPTDRQCGMLRQAVLAHAEHVTLAELRSGIRGRLVLRWRQLQAARRMLKGIGEVPHMPGTSATVSFAQIGQVQPAQEDAIRIDDLLRRYVIARIEGDSVFGAGYYAWPVLEGLGALCLSVAVAGWLARCLAAAGGAGAIRFDDAANALGMVDRAATRLPALGTWAERSRIQYLFMNDGLARLLFADRLVGSS